MPIKVHLQDGRIVNFPDGMPPEQIQAEVSKLATPKQERGWGDTLTDALPSIGGAVGGMVGNVPGAMIGGAAGEGFKQLATKAGEIPGAISDIAGNLTSQPKAMAGGFLRGAFGGANEAAGQSALQGATQGVGNIAGAGIQMVGRGLYRAGALPLVQQFGKYGDLVKKGVEARIPVTQGGLQKAAALKTAAQATKRAAVDTADENVQFLSPQIGQNIKSRLAPSTTALKQAGLPDPSKMQSQRIAQFVKENPNGKMVPPTHMETPDLPDSVDAALRAHRDLGPLAKNIPTAVFGGDAAAVNAARQVHPMAVHTPRRMFSTEVQQGKAFDLGGRVEREGSLTPSRMESIKHTWDDVSGGAFEKMRQRKPLSPSERFTVSASHEAGDALADVVPNYKAMNREVMDMEGLRRMIARRLMGNQGLENAVASAAAVVNPVGALAGRVGMLPGVMSTAGIGVNEAGKYAPNVVSNLVRAAILAQLEQDK